MNYRFFASVLLLVALVSGCVQVKDTGNQATGKLKEFTVTAKQFEFNPATITVNKGDTVRLTITSLDVPHGFRINEFNVNARIEPGKTAAVEFIADKSGTFTFFCSVVCGAGHSDMKGTLVVK